MAGITGIDLNTVNRRMASISGHLLPGQTRPGNGVALWNCSSRPNDSHHRLHDELLAHIPQWEKFNEWGKDFTDIIYEKAVGEGIAKVRALCESQKEKTRDVIETNSSHPTFISSGGARIL